jgi:SNF2 family DNA or RNA helicase
MLKRQSATVGAGDGKSAKYERLRELIESYRNEGRKVLIFSFFKRVLDDACEIVGNCAQITGGMPPTRRQQVIDSFTNIRGFAALALQIDAGGLGVNLQAAEVVILMEPQFKPSTERQAIARAHRMGQTRKVTVHRLLALQTIDVHLVKLIAKKAKLFEDYAHHSSVKDASEMAIDTNLQEIESELSLMIANER